MKNPKCHLIPPALLLATLLSVPAAQTAAPPNPARGLWQEVATEFDALAEASFWVKPPVFRAFTLDVEAMRELLQTAPPESAVAAAAVSPSEIILPMPDGTQARFQFVESPVMAPELAAKFPEIKTYLGQGVDDPRATVRFDLTPAGFHAQVLSPDGAAYIDPLLRDDVKTYAVYWRRDHHWQAKDWACFTPPGEPVGDPGDKGGLGILRSGSLRRTYRLAVAATGEYTAFHGGTVSQGQAAIVTAINRVTGIYEIEVAGRLTLVANNSQLVYTSPATDPYSNSDGATMLGQNQTTVDSVIGSGNYDIGHVFSTGGGGIAGLGVVCVNGAKARGVTGSPSPTGDAFWVDYVAHEMGHQFGANHTFNSTTSSCGGGNRNASTAYEPGSGSTIMAYSGICGADDLQFLSDVYFHSISFDEILAYTTSGSGSVCPASNLTGNNAPTVSAGANYTIPARTPFTLTATGSDPNGDPLTYCWEERDLGVATTLAAADNGSSPIFRSWTGTTNPSRTFPRLAELLNNTVPLGEKLPITTRLLRFRVTARDHRAGGGGVNTADMQVNVVSNTAAFAITSHNTAGVRSGPQTITWNVANTASSPINTANVRILLSTNGGQAFPITLAASTPNDGSETVVLPNLTTTAARLKLEAVGNIFFDISNTNFTIVPAALEPQVTLDSFTLAMEGCVPANSVIDPGETVTVLVGLRNAGTAPTTNLVVTLLATNGVTPLSDPQDYGALAASGAAVVRPFAFTAAGACGGGITARFQLQDGAASLDPLAQPATLGVSAIVTTGHTNLTPVAIPGGGTTGAGDPYPSTIEVPAVSGTVQKVTVTLRDLSHSYPDDVDVLLVGPGGQKVLLMSDVGGGNSLAGVTLTFDDDAGASLPDSGVISSGACKPTNFGATTDTFAAPAPAAPYVTNLAVFKGQNPQGTWSLYIVDDSSQDTGALAGGWSLSLTISNVTCCTYTPLADLALSATAFPQALNEGGQAEFTFGVTNQGPDPAADVLVTSALPPGLAFVSAVSSQGTCAYADGVVTCALDSLAGGGEASLVLTLTAAQGGLLTATATVSSGVADPAPADNTASASVLVNALPVISAIADLTVPEDSPGPQVNFAIADAETPADELSVSAGSSNPTLVPDENLLIEGKDSNRTLTLTLLPDASGEATITVSVSDGLAVAHRSFLLTVTPVNDPPVLTPLPDFTVTEGDTLTVTNLASDVDAPAQELLYSLAEGAPAGATVKPATGVFEWTPAEDQGPGSYPLTVIVTDSGVPPRSATQTFTVTVLETNLPPALTPVPDQTVAVGQTLWLTNSATDPDLPANTLTFSLEPGAPDGAGIEPDTGVFSWTPDGEQLGAHLIGLTVTDDGEPILSATQSFTVLVVPPNQPPTLEPVADQTLHARETLTLTLAASDPDAGDALGFSFDTAPAGAALDGATGRLTWAPEDDQTGAHLFVVRVTDNGWPPLSATQSFAVVVQSRPILSPVNYAAGTTSLAWSAIPGRSYRVEFKDDLLAPDWMALEPDVVAGAATAQFTDTKAGPGPRFYRVRVLP